MQNNELSLDNLTVSNLPELAGWEQKQNEIVEANPFIEIVDNTTYEEGKKRRTALLKARTAIEGQDKIIASKLTVFRKGVKDEGERLISITLPHEEKQQTEVKRYEAILEEKRLEKERKEQERIDGIKARIQAIESACYAIIQKMNFESISKYHAAVCEQINEPNDFEEYDVLFRQAEARVLKSFDDKQADLRERESQRIERERLEKENEERRQREQLQNARLQQIMPYVAYAKDTNLTELHLISETEFNTLLTDAKSNNHAFVKAEQEKAAQAEKERIEREEKERVERNKIFEIRKQRLLGIGLVLNSDVFHNDVLVSLPNANYVYMADTFEFEDIYNTAKSAIEKSLLEKQMAQRFESRLAELKSLGYVPGRINEWAYNGGFPVSHFNIDTMHDDEWATFVEAVHEFIADYQTKIKEADKANKAKQKKLKSDKNALADYIESLTFNKEVPNLENAECEEFLQTCHNVCAEVMKELLNQLKEV